VFSFVCSFVHTPHLGHKLQVIAISDSESPGASPATSARGVLAGGGPARAVPAPFTDDALADVAPPLPPGVPDIHLAGDEGLALGRGGEYMRAYVAYLWKADGAEDHLPNAERRPRPQATVDADMRKCLVDWLGDIASEFKITRSTLFLAVNLLDRMLDVLPVHRDNLQLHGCACFLVAAKLEEVQFTCCIVPFCC
jgi:hypothetical protein